MSGGRPPGRFLCQKPPAIATGERAVDENKAASPAIKVDYGAGRGYPLGSAGFPSTILPTMPATPDELFAYLDRLGIAHSTVSHPPMFTVNEAQSLRGTLPGGHNKNLFLKDRFGALYLVVLLEDARINLKTLPDIIGSGRISFGSADLLREVLGVEPGSVTPFALINDTARRVTPVLDATMLEHDILNYHPLLNTMTTTIARDDLIRFVQSTGHTPMIRPVAETSAA